MANKMYEGKAASLHVAYTRLQKNVGGADLATKLADYNVTITDKTGTKLGTGQDNSNHEAAYKVALENAGLAKYNPRNHNVSISAYVKQQESSAPRPSGAAPISARGEDITNLF